MPSLPTLDELAELRDLNEVPQSNLLRLEVEELLKESAVDLGGKSALACKEQLFELRETLLALPSRSDVSFDSVKVAGLEPGMLWEKDKVCQMKFQAPADIFVAGSFALQTVTKGKRSVDLCIRIPDACLDAKDYLNYRYLNKRRLYLGVVAEELLKQQSTKEKPNSKKSKKKKKSSKSDEESDASRKPIQWKIACSTFHGDQTKPILVLSPPKRKGFASFKINVIPVISQTTFPLRRFLPHKNNVRRRRTLERRRLDNRNQVQDDEEPATFMYNMRMLEEMAEISFRTHLEVLFATSKSCPGLPDAITLMKAWIRKRNLSQGCEVDGVNVFVLSMLTVYLLQQGTLKKHMSGLQLFKSLIHYLATVDLTAKVMRLKPVQAQTPDNEESGDDDDDEQGPLLQDEDLTKYFPLVLLAPCGQLNLAFRVSQASYSIIRHEAVISNEVLTNNGVGGRDVFDSLFATTLDFWSYYDNYFSMNVPENPPSIELLENGEYGDVENTMEAMLCNGPWAEYVRWRAETLLTKGFVDTERAKVVRVFQHTGDEWKVNEPAPKTSKLLVCISLNPENSLRLVDKGPDFSDEVATKEFRDFWGNRSELRRFQDGAIVETVVWTDEDGKTNKPKIPFLVTKHIFSVHEPFKSMEENDRKLLSITSPLLNHLQNTLEKRFLPSWVPPMENQDRAQEAYRKSIEVFNELEKDIRSLSLPLEPKTVEACDASLRYSSVIPPYAHPLAYGRNDNEKFELINQWKENIKGRKRKRASGESSTWVSRILKPMDVVLQLEQSGRWPDDVEAINHMKVAFYLQIAGQLERKSKGMVRCQVADTHMDVLRDGYVFRLVIRHSREIDLLCGTVQAGGIAQAASQKRTPRELEERKRRGEALRTATVARPLLHSKLQGLHHQAQYAQSMSMVVRLAKLWVNGHGLALHLSTEAVELIVASLYVHPSPFEPPRAPASGFLRFLSLVNEWDWENAPLVVDINKELSSQDLSAITNGFFKARDSGKAPPMCIVVPEDRDSEWQPTWTSKLQPSAVALKHIVHIAKQSVSLVKGLLDAYAKGNVKQTDALWNAIFKSSAKDIGCDAIISLDAVALIGLVEGDSKKNSGLGQVALYKNLASAAEDKAIVGLNPLESYVKDLEQHFSPYAEFYCDGLQGKEVGVKWSRSSLDDKAVPFRVAAASYSKPVDGESELSVKLNREEMLHTMASLGEGIVERVVLMEE